MSEDLGVRFERFARGPDLGMDLRAQRGKAKPDIVQVKHYRGSAYSTLRADVRKEAKKVEALKPQARDPPPMEPGPQLAPLCA